MEILKTTDWSQLIFAALPIWLLVTGAILILIFSAVAKTLPHSIYWVIAALLALSSLFLVGAGWWRMEPTSIALLSFDRLAFCLDAIFLIALFLSLFFSHDYLKERGLEGGEYYTLLLLTTAGLMLIAHAADLLILFLGIEIASLSAYILAGFQRGSVRSYEAALKYFILGSFASGFLLYGIALLFGATGSTDLADIAKISDLVSDSEGILMGLGSLFLLVGVAFKIAAVPFQFWSPDVYEGAPTPVTGLMASAVKAGGFAALLRLVVPLMETLQVPWAPIFWTLSALTMTVGNLMALRQTNIKRMLAYSSIAHAGYALVGVAAAFQEKTSFETTLAAVLFYLFAYSFMTLGAFGVVVALGRGSSEPDEISEYASLAEKRPVLAASLTFFLLSLIGIPPTIGFVGKFYLFSGAVQAGLTGLVVVAVLNSAVSVYYYLGPIVKMYFQKGNPLTPQPVSKLLVAGLVICLFAVLYLGLLPTSLMVIAQESVKGMLF
ncbi:MAG: NADH-quinone oxidoreductase subunit N [Deltaproteobacteria bacterium]|nr:NADH-quinone oxidoreductase subunit N [Deltaproteobacteria bacterium]